MGIIIFSMCLTLSTILQLLSLGMLFFGMSMGSGDAFSFLSAVFHATPAQLRHSFGADSVILHKV